MTMALLAPSITGTIGRQTRVYQAFITTALTAHDTPSPVTLRTASLTDVARRAVHDLSAQQPVRDLVLQAYDAQIARAEGPAT